MIKAIIIDDERLARNELKKLLMDFPEIEVVAEAANAEKALKKSNTLIPILFSLIYKCRVKQDLICCRNWTRPT